MWPLCSHSLLSRPRKVKRFSQNISVKFATSSQILVELLFFLRLRYTMLKSNGPIKFLYLTRRSRLGQINECPPGLLETKYMTYFFQGGGGGVGEECNLSIHATCDTLHSWMKGICQLFPTISNLLWWSKCFWLLFFFYLVIGLWSSIVIGSFGVIVQLRHGTIW